MTNWRFESAKSIARRIRKKVDRELRQDLDDLIEDIDAGIFIDAKRIDEAKMIGLRNPSFDGDMIGWLDDDFDDDDEEDIENNNKPAGSD